MSGPIVLLDGSTVITGNPLRWKGGEGVFKAASAGWNGATVALEYKDPAGNWVQVGGETVLTSASTPQAGVFTLDECEIRAAVTVAAPSAGVYATVGRTDNHG